MRKQRSTGESAKKVPQSCFTSRRAWQIDAHSTRWHSYASLSPQTHEISRRVWTRSWPNDPQRHFSQKEAIADQGEGYWDKKTLELRGMTESTALSIPDEKTVNRSFTCPKSYLWISPRLSKQTSFTTLDFDFFFLSQREHRLIIFRGGGCDDGLWFPVLHALVEMDAFVGFGFSMQVWFLNCSLCIDSFLDHFEKG